jgi:broad specificity phosphatase PhoE
VKPKRIVLVRHGESEGNVDKEKYFSIPDYKLNLTDHGRQQAVHAGEEIAQIIGDESIYAYVAPYFRTRQTFESIYYGLKHNLVKAVEDPRIREQD